MRRLIGGFALLACIAHATSADANMAKWYRDGDTSGLLVPQSDTEVRVDSEDLSFVIGPDLQKAQVTATYHMTNAGPAESQTNIAFVMASAEAAEDDVAHAAVTIDGAPVPGQLVTEIEVLEPLLEKWLAANPKVEAELARIDALPNPTWEDKKTLPTYVPGCVGECTYLYEWWRARKYAATSADKAAKPRNRDVVRRAAREAIPAEIAKVQNGWAAKRASDTPLSWLTFSLTMAPGASRTVSVKYDHTAGSNSRYAVNTVFIYEYLLSPAKRWARFGDLHIDIQAPPDTIVRQSSIPLTANGNSFHADTKGLPAGDLEFEVMSKKGLVFGLTQPSGYWAMLAGLMALVTIALSRFIARSRRPALSGVASGILSIFANGIVAAMFAQVVPNHALGFAYDALFGQFLLFASGALLAIAVGVVSAKRAKAATP